MIPQTALFSQLRVAAFESRRAVEMTRLIERMDGMPLVSPSMREVAVDEDRPVIDFANRLITGQIDVVIFLTGVGVRQLVDRIERHVNRQRFLDALSDIQTVVRGLKPLAALKEIGVTPTIRVPEPNTWREILAALDQQLPVANLVVTVQEYGLPNVSLTAGLEARGATVESLVVYRWDLPEDTGPLEDNVHRLVDGSVDIVLFTAAQQVAHLLRVAKQLDMEAPLRDGFRQVVVASIGPTTSEMLRENALPVDFEPSHAKMGHLVHEMAEKAVDMVRRKRALSVRLTTPANDPQKARGKLQPGKIARF